MLKTALCRGYTHEGNYPTPPSSLLLKLLPCLLLPFLLMISTKGTAQNITYTGKNVSLETVFTEIKKQTGYSILYTSNTLAGTKPVSIEFSSMPLPDFLQGLLKNQPLRFSIEYKTIIITRRKSTDQPAGSQPGEAEQLPGNRQITSPVSGTVVSNEQQPLEGAMVMAKSLKTYVVTDAQGRFTINAPGGEVLEISFIGYKTEELQLTAGTFAVSNAAQGLVIRLVPFVNTIEDVKVVNTGYQRLKPNEQTGSFDVIKSKQLEQIPLPNILQRMESMMPGLNIDLLQSDASLTFRNPLQNTIDNSSNSSYKIQIRGVSTLNANQSPLIVLNGVITEFDLRTLNPDDIEQITVLKDAAAASIWGIRAANGVLVIQTKKGTASDKINVNFSANYNVAGAPRLKYIPQMNAAQTIDYELDLITRGIITDPLLNSFSPPRYLDQAQELIFQQKRGNISLVQRDSGLNALSQHNSYNQISKYLLQPYRSQQYNLNISGGTANATYYYSASFASDQTNEKGTGGKRLNLTGSNDFKLFKWATLSTNFQAAFSRFRYNGIGFSTLIPSSTQLMPYDQLVEANGKSIDYSYAYYYPVLNNLEKQGYLNWRYNYLNELREANNQVKDNSFNFNIALTVPLYKGISLNSTYAFEKSYRDAPYLYNEQTYKTRDLVNNFTIFGPTGQLVYGLPKGEILSQSNFGQDNYVIRNQINYTSTFNPNHLINAIAGVELRQTTTTQNNYTYYGYNDQAQSFVPLSNLNNLQQAVTGYNQFISNNGSISTGISRRFLSYYTNASYTFKNKYTVSGSSRLDDYNNFGLDKKYRRTPLWSAGFSWNAIQESFFKKLPWLSQLTARFTYGVNGNISLTNLPFTTFSTVSNDPITQQPSVGIVGLSNPSFRWERTTVINYGLNFGLLKNRVTGTIDVYQKKGKDLLYQYLTDPTYGSGSVYRNGAKLDGKGVELTLNLVALEKKNWTYTPTLNLGYNSNKVVSIPVAAPSLAAGYVGYLPNYSTDYLFVYRWAGLDQNGQPLVYDQDGKKLDNKTPITTRNALKYAGRTSPPYRAAINQNLRFKNFNLFIQVQGLFGYVFLKRSLGRYQTNSFYSYLDLSRDIAYRWRQPGDEKTTNVPGLTGVNFNSLDRYSNSDRMVEPGDHIRLRQVSLSYKIPDAWSRKMKMSNLSLTAGARDLGLLWRKNNSGIDPNYQPALANITNLPPAVSYTFSLNASF